MRYVEAPERVELKVGVRGIFLAGGITNCSDWQSDVVERFGALGIGGFVVFSPRRKDFPIGDSNAAPEQIKWEYDYLRYVDAILFWFPCETLCPIVLYELGAWSMTDKPIFVGVHPDYQRRLDVEIQIGLIRPEVEIVYSLDELATQVVSWLGEGE